MKHYLKTGIARDAVRSRTILLAYLSVLILLSQTMAKSTDIPCLLCQLFPPMAVQFEAAGG